MLCQPCALNQSGECAQYCVHCPTPFPSPQCWVSFTPCAPGDCCPSGQSPCYVPGKTQSCCLPGYSCCDPETGFCCPPLETCCNPAAGFCCKSGQTPCCSTEKNLCCPPGQICCDPGNLCTDVSSDLSNCGVCGKVCPPGPPNSTRTCINGECGWACNSGYFQCGNACCPSGYGCCNSVCTPLNSAANCGACGKVCPTGPPNSTRTCVNGECGWACNSGYTQCRNACCTSGYGCCNGVCTPLNTTANCGACGKACPPAPANSTLTCTNGECRWACNSGYTQCGNACCSPVSQCPGGAGCMCIPGGCNTGLTCTGPSGSPPSTCVTCGGYSDQCCDKGTSCNRGLTCQYSPSQNSYTCLP